MSGASYHDPPTPHSSTNLLNSPWSSTQKKGGTVTVTSSQLSFSTANFDTYSSAGNRDTMSSKFSLPPDPSIWAKFNGPEPDDILHNPDPRRDKGNDAGGTVFTARGFANLGCLAFLSIGIVTLFAGYPLISFFTKSGPSYQGGFNLGGTNATGQVPDMTGHKGLIDVATPAEAKTRASFYDPTKTMQLVWSDEFEVDGRSFYPGDDPYWEALDLQYWQTVDVEWYDPAAVSTRNGALELTLSRKDTHGVKYQGGMVTTWNKFCFTGGLIETAVTLPGAPNILGFWPAVWTMGNLGRVGYGATTDGLWPYSYDSCDYGAIANQTKDGLPAAAFEVGKGDQYHDDKLSFLPGQRLSRCTCAGESHPGPTHSDGSYVGRASPEIDVFEAAATASGGNMSLSGQFAPFNYNYEWPTDGNLIIPDLSTTSANSYMGGAYQQAISALAIANQSCYELVDGCFAVMGVEYKPGFDDAYITWINNNEVAWTMLSGGLAADTKVEIGPRAVSQEPMYIIANFGMSNGFVQIDFEHLTFPAKMRIDYVRVYQDADSINVGCDPEDFPTKAYIDEYMGAYTNPNLTTWKDFGESFPKNSFIDTC
ncbi:beta-glucan synthesis-associated [Amylostereum chailletii]|nr:beta-glucan synthesis-associated [Amylostereum chailletii]